MASIVSNQGIFMSRHRQKSTQHPGQSSYCHPRIHSGFFHIFPLSFRQVCRIRSFWRGPVAAVAFYDFASNDFVSDLPLPRISRISRLQIQPVHFCRLAASSFRLVFHRTVSDRPRRRRNVALQSTLAPHLAGPLPIRRHRSLAGPSAKSLHPVQLRRVGQFRQSGRAFDFQPARWQTGPEHAELICAEIAPQSAIRIHVTLGLTRRRLRFSSLFLPKTRECVYAIVKISKVVEQTTHQISRRYYETI